MNRNVAGAEPHLKVVARPSLYTSQTPQNDSDKHASILSSLESDTPARKMSRKWFMSISVVLLALGLSYWAYVNAIFQKPIVIPPWIETALNISKAPIPVVQPPVQPIITKLEKPAEAPTEEFHAATIVTESTAPVSPEPAMPNGNASDKVAMLEADPVKKKSIEQQPVAVPVVSKQDNIQKPQANEKTAHADAAVPKSATRVATTAHTATHQKTAVSKKNAKDDDVDLIAALLNRVSGHPDASGKEIKHKKTTASSTSTTGVANTKRKNKTDPNRDIVTKADGDTTEDLLKRCKALGFFEGELCRVRICSQLWGKDPACPVPEQVALPGPN